MSLSKTEIKQRIETFQLACRESGAKVTPQRLEIFKEVAGSEEHPHAEQIYQAVSRRLPTISLDTVYRTLWWLTELGLAVPLGPTQERTRFDANLERHHHFICAHCGLTRDFYSEELEKLNLPASITEIGSATGAQVEVKGICHNCAARQLEEAEK